MKTRLPILFLLVILFLVGGFFLIKKEKPMEQNGGEAKMELSGKKILMVVAPKDFRDEEFAEPKKVLEKNGAVVEVASRGVNEAVGMFGAKATVDKDISQVNVDDYDAIVFVGGSGASIYFNDQTVLSLAKAAFEKGKIISAICIAPSILANAGILLGKKATAFSSEQNNLQDKGAQYTGEEVTVDGKIVTADGPQAATEFGRKLVEALGR